MSVTPRRLTRARELIWWAAFIAVAGIGFVVGKHVVGGNPLLEGSLWGWFVFTVVSTAVGGLLYFVLLVPLGRWLGKTQRRSG